MFKRELSYCAFIIKTLFSSENATEKKYKLVVAHLVPPLFFYQLERPTNYVLIMIQIPHDY